MVRAALVLALTGLAGPVAAQQAGQGPMPTPQGRDVTLTGTVIDVSCKFGQGLSGDAHRMCSQVCGDNGLPLAILGSDGKLYVPVTPEMPGMGQNARLKEFAEQRVSVRGKVFAAAGAQVIQIDAITPAR